MNHHELGALAARAGQRCGPDVTPRAAERVIAALLAGASVWGLYKLAAQPIKQVQALLQTFAEAGLIEWDTPGSRLAEARRALASRLGLERARNAECTLCNGRGIRTELDESVRAQFLAIQTQRPGAERQFVQGFVTPESTFARAPLAMARGDVAGKDILVVGAEDDLIGLALALTRKPRSVTALDLDPRLVAFDNR